MKLKPGFKRFIFIAIITGVVGVGLYNYTPSPAKPKPVTVEVAVDVEEEAPPQKQVKATVQAEKSWEAERPVAPVEAAPASNTGLQNVLNAGKK